VLTQILILSLLINQTLLTVPQRKKMQVENKAVRYLHRSKDTNTE